MAETPSTRTLPLGAPAPAIHLADPSGKAHTLDSLRGPKGLVVAFVCNHCPYVVHLAKAMANVATEAMAQGVGFVAINANDPGRYAADAPENMPAFAKASGWTFPYLVDAEQSVAKAYFAACTPDFYVFDSDLRLTYAGQFDSSRPGNGKPVTGEDLLAAIRAAAAGAPPVAQQRPSIGCSIKWKPGHAPAYFG